MQFISDALPFVLVFATVAFVVVAIGSFFTTDGSLQRRLEIGPTANEGNIRARPKESWFYRSVVQPLQRYILPPDIQQRSSLRLWLLQGGYTAPTAPAVYYATRIALGIGLPVVIGLFAAFLLARVQSILVILVVSGIVGYMVPTFIVSRRVSARQRLTREGFPDALDMMLMCVEAGLGLDAAINRVGQEIRLPHPILAEQFDLLAAEIRAGKMRDEAFRAFSDRIGVEEVRAFIALLVQSEELGTNMAEALRSMSEDMRQRRLLRAEELANMVSTKLSMVLALIIVPVLLAVIVSPAGITAYRNFSQLHMSK
jgi:tight adherence protein C